MKALRELQDLHSLADAVAHRLTAGPLSLDELRALAPEDPAARAWLSAWLDDYDPGATRHEPELLALWLVDWPAWLYPDKALPHDLVAYGRARVAALDAAIHNLRGPGCLSWFLVTTDDSGRTIGHQVQELAEARALWSNALDAAKTRPPLANVRESSTADGDDGEGGPSPRGEG